MLKTCPLLLASDLPKHWFLFMVCMQRGTTNAGLFLFSGKYNIYNSKLILPDKERNAEKTSLLQVTPFIIVAQWKPQQTLKTFYELKFILKYSTNKSDLVIPYPKTTNSSGSES